MEQVVGCGVDLDTIPAGLLQASGAGGEPVDQLFDLVDGENVGRLLVVDIERRGERHHRRSHRFRDQRVDPAPGTAVIELGEIRHAVLVDLSGELGEA